MKVTSMETPKTRQEFEYRLHLLHASISGGKLIMNEGVVEVLGNSLLKMRSMHNGRIDLLTIDEPVRLQANMMASFDENLFDSIRNVENSGGFKG